MSGGRVLYHLVKADFLERVRRYSFLLTLVSALYLAYAAATGQIVLRLDEYRGVNNSAWIGSMMALVSSVFLSLAGFYMVKNSVLRDQQTRVGRILASTPMTRQFYTVAKFLSNFVVLAAMMSVLALAAVFLQLTRAEDPTIHLLTLLAPFVWVGLPAMAFIAGLAVLFETVPGLGGGLGNVIYFFGWGLLFGMGVQSGRDDIAGFNIIGRDMQAVLRALDPAYKNGISLTLSNSGQPTSKVFLWPGVNWTAPMMLHRLLWVAAAVGTALLASTFFHRFDPAREWKKRPGKLVSSEDREDASLRFAQKVRETTGQHAESYSAPVHLSPVKAGSYSASLGSLVIAELRLLLKGQAWWWYAGAAGMLIGQTVSPDLQTRQGFLLAAWLWPVLVWSQMGSREARYQAQSLIFSSQRTLYRQLPALWSAGVLVAMLVGGGYGVRLLASGDFSGLLAWLSAVLFVPSLALALGVWSGSSKAFEAIYSIWWYAGPLHHTPGIDFMGTSAASREPGLFLLGAGILLAAAYSGRRLRSAYA
jgi:hypothetical protein